MTNTYFPDYLLVMYVLREQVRNSGIFLETGTDFQFFKEITLKLQRDTQLGPKFDPDCDRYVVGTAFWVIGRNASGKIVHTQAISLENLTGLSLSTYLQKRFTEFIPFQTDPQFTRFFPGPGSRSMLGVICYHGEFWLQGGANCYRGVGLATPLTRYALLLAMMIWSPDYIFAFMRSEIAHKGLAAKAGFMHTEPDSITWKRMGDSKIHKSWTVWLGREDIHHLMKLTAIDLGLLSADGHVASGQNKQVALYWFDRAEGLT